QFRAISDQLYRTPDHHKDVREQVVKQLKSQPEMYDGYVPMSYVEYLKKMSKGGEWGDHVTLQAAADWV
ncbi:OTU domain-containing protein, partial [Cephalotus follicularis]